MRFAGEEIKFIRDFFNFSRLRRDLPPIMLQTLDPITENKKTIWGDSQREKNALKQ